MNWWSEILRRYLAESPFLPCVVALLAHWLCIFNGFTFDDFPDIINHPAVNGKVPWWHLIYYNFMGGQLGSGHPTFRPFTTFLYAMGWRLWGDAPLFFHLMNLGLFMGATVLVQRVCRLFLEKKHAMLCALLFASQAIHVTNVANIAHGAETLALVLMLSAFLLGIKKRWLPTIGIYILAMMSKESATLMPFLIYAYWFAKEGFWPALNPKDRGGLPLALLVTGVLFVAVRSWWLPIDMVHVMLPDNPLMSHGLAVRLWIPFVLLGTYLLRILVPIDFSIDYTYNSIPMQVDITNGKAWLGIGFTVAIVFAMLRYWPGILGQKKDAETGGHETTSEPAPAVVTHYNDEDGEERFDVALDPKREVLLNQGLVFAVGAFLVSYAIFSNTVFLITVIMAERLFLGPSVWVTLFSFVALLKLYYMMPKLKSVLIFCFAIFLVMQLPNAMLRTTDWRDNYTIFKRITEVFPANVKGQFYTAREMAEHNEHKEAFWHLALAVMARNTLATAFYNTPFGKDVKEWGKTKSMRDGTVGQFDFPLSEAQLKLPIDKRLAMIPKLLDPDVPPLAVFSKLRVITARVLGKEGMKVLEEVARKYSKSNDDGGDDGEDTSPLKGIKIPSVPTATTKPATSRPARR